jgi:ankyrin repeat protein
MSPEAVATYDILHTTYAFGPPLDISPIIYYKTPMDMSGFQFHWGVKDMKRILLAALALLAMAGLAVSAYAQNSFTLPGEDDLELLMKAASTGDMVTLEAQIVRNKDLVNQRSGKDGKTALHIAVINGKAPAVEMLLNHGADPNARDFYCKTPYYYARVAYRTAIARLLVKRGARAEYVRFFPNCCTQMNPNPARSRVPASCR